MTQPPTDPGCPIFGEDGKVLTDSDGRVLSRDFVPRSPVSTQINGSVLKVYEKADHIGCELVAVRPVVDE